MSFLQYSAPFLCQIMWNISRMFSENKSAAAASKTKVMNLNRLSTLSTPSGQNCMDHIPPDNYLIYESCARIVCLYLKHLFLSQCVNITKLVRPQVSDSCSHLHHLQSDNHIHLILTTSMGNLWLSLT